MRVWLRISKVCIVSMVMVALIGCGGGGGNASGGSAPTSKTLSDVASHLFGYGQSIVSTSFSVHGPKMQSHGVAFFDSALGLWATVRLGSSDFYEALYEDESTTVPAGDLNYATVDITQSQSGSISVTLGRCAGLTGTFNQALQPNGYNGNINYSIPNVSSVVSTFTLNLSGSGVLTGTSTNAVALQSGYTQNEKIVNNADGSLTVTTSDGNSCQSVFNFAADLSGTGKITGSDPGLPAVVSWNSTGVGSVTYADGTAGSFSAWQLAGSTAGIFRGAKSARRAP